MLAGESGPARQWAIDHQIQVGHYLGAEDFVPVIQAHVMADTELLGVAGVAWLERWQRRREQRRVRIPTITDPRGTDFAGGIPATPRRMLALERRAIAAFEGLGVMMTDTCINYQTIAAGPQRTRRFRRHRRGDLFQQRCGARSNFEGGPSALSAGITGAHPALRLSPDEAPQATLQVNVDATPLSLNEWGALGGVIGRLAGDYWQVPVIDGIERVPASDQLKHFGAAMASFGSMALFHLVGLTPEAARLDDVMRGECRAHRVGRPISPPCERATAGMTRSTSWCSRRRS